MDKKPNISTINLKLGDIIEIQAPDDESINNKIYYILYIDLDLIELIDEKCDKKILYIKENKLVNESIKTIIILSRSKEIGYSRQNNLLVDKWINIYFNGDIPFIITGKITGLNEDQIEVKIHNTDDIIYIDFKYQGLPKNIPIEKINIRNTPTDNIPQDNNVIEDEFIQQEEIDEDDKDSLDKTSKDKKYDDDKEELQQMDREDLDQEQRDNEEDDSDSEYVKKDEQDLNEDSDIKKQNDNLDKLFFTADQINTGIKLESVTYEIDVPESERRYDIDTQTNDLLNDILSQVPTANRKRSVLNNISLMIDRYKQLRNEFSNFTKEQYAMMPKKLGANHKPLVNSLEKLNKKLYWILPVCKNIKKVYDFDDNLNNTEDLTENDITIINYENDLNEQIQALNVYFENTSLNEENKYIYLMRTLKYYTTPYNYLTDIDSISNDILTQLKVNDNIFSVIDNNDDFKSSVIKIKEDNYSIQNKFFNTQSHILGDTMLEGSKIKGDKTTFIREITDNDDIFIKSFITLPESTVRFSHINLPGSNLYLKANLNKNFIQYWNILNNKTNVKQTIINDENNSYDFESKKYLQSIVEYIHDDSKEKDYKKYLDYIIPKTKILFELIQSYMTNCYTLNSVIKYMEPFMIYLKDISYQQYISIIKFISNKIREYKINLVNKNKDFQIFEKKLTNNKHDQYILKILSEKELLNSIIEYYRLDKIPYRKMSNSELLIYFSNIDNKVFYNLIISYINIKLFTSANIDIYDKLNDYIKSNDETLKNKDSQCNVNVLSKKYYEIDELESDNNKEISFDKQYDNTYYDLLNEYESLLDRNSMSKEEMIKIVSDKLIENNGVNMNNAFRDAKAMINKKKLVENDDYAVLINEIDNSYHYYKRNNDVWEKDISIPENVSVEDSNLFCNINEKCLNIKNNCLDDSDVSEKMYQDNLKKFISEFDTSLLRDKNKIIKNINLTIELYKSKIALLFNLSKLNKNKENYINYNLGLEAEETDIVISPYKDILDKILGQGDFIKRQTDIIKFINMYTRQSINDENIWWLYCNKTGTKILPTFISKLANVFNNKGNYLQTIQEICKQQGDLSEDGELWVDKYTGYTITNIDFNTDEGYSDEGYKIVTSSVIEQDIGNIIFNTSESKGLSFTDSISLNIYNVIKSISDQCGVNINNYIEIIIRDTLKSLKTIKSEEMYNLDNQEKKDKGKSVEPYNIYQNRYIVIFALSYYAIEVITSIPSIKTRKRFPGCIYSFNGYPVTGVEDITGIKYIACIANKIKNKNNPWNGIYKVKEETLVSNIKKVIESIVEKQEDIKQKIAKKIAYNNSEIIQDIPDELNISKWINFLPPLVKYTVKEEEAISELFINELKNNIRKGSNQILEKINILKTKIFNYSLQFQKHINTIVENENAILTNNNKEPFLENSCCDNGNINTYRYFIDKDPNIDTYKLRCQEIENILSDITNKPCILFNNENTKKEILNVPETYSEEIIYKTFISYCKIDSNLPITDDIKQICRISKPDNYDVNDNINEKILKLKSNGNNYNTEDFNVLMNRVNNKNIVSTHINTININNKTLLLEMIEKLTKKNINVFQYSPKFLELLNIVVNKLEVNNLTDDYEEMRNLKNYLSTENNNIEIEIKHFIHNNSNTKTRKDILYLLDNIVELKVNNNSKYIEDEDFHICKIKNFISNTIDSLINLFPSIILNNIDYSNFTIPSHWELSSRHNLDLINITKDYYNILKKYQSNDNLRLILPKLIEEMRDIKEIMNNILFHIPIKLNDTDYLYSTFDRRLILLLSKFYFNTVIYHYINILKNEEISLLLLEKLEVKDFLPSEFEVEQEFIGNTDIFEGDMKKLNEVISDMICSFGTIIYKNKVNIDYTYEDIKNAVIISKEKEKDIITDHLRQLSDEEREVENLFKNHKLEQWNKGMQKGVRIYQSDTYDEEREAMENQIRIETELNKKDFVSDMNRNIYTMDIENEEITIQMEEEERNGLSRNYGEDDEGRPDDDDDPMYY